MLPKTAIPKAPPSSELVSEIPDAAPARSGGAVPTRMSVARVVAGARPKEKSHGPDDEHSESGGVADLGEETEARGRESKPASHDECRTNSAHHHRRQQRTDDEPAGVGQRPQARLKRREPQHQLQVLRDEEKGPEVDEEVEGVDGQGCAEGGHPEEPQVDQWVGQRSLSAKENDAEGEPGQDGQHGQPPRPSWAICLRP